MSLCTFSFSSSPTLPNPKKLDSRFRQKAPLRLFFNVGEFPVPAVVLVVPVIVLGAGDSARWCGSCEDWLMVFMEREERLASDLRESSLRMLCLFDGGEAVLDVVRGELRARLEPGLPLAGVLGVWEDDMGGSIWEELLVATRWSLACGLPETGGEAWPFRVCASAVNCLLREWLEVGCERRGLGESIEIGVRGGDGGGEDLGGGMEVPSVRESWGMSIAGSWNLGL